MQRKIISIVLCLAMIVSVFAISASAEAATVESTGTETVGVSKVESADDFSWDNANVYFLLTDRFYNGNTSNDHSYGRALNASGQPLSGWNTAPGTFHGGDFAGITQKINEGYFTDLGVNAIWISAPYEQIHGYVTSGGDTQPANYAHYSYHGYYVLDYTETDANFGTKAEFKTMVDTAHSRGIRVVMDIVMNHTGYNNILDMLEYNYGTISDKNALKNCQYTLTNAGQFHDYIKYDADKGGQASDWANWWGNDWIRSGVAGYTDGNGGDELHQCLVGLPDFRTESTKSVSIPKILQTKWQKEGTLAAKTAKYGSSGTVSDYLTTWLAEWVETYGVDGFRCDTAKHVELASWKKLKTKCVAALNKWRQNNPTSPGADWDEDFWMTGECWGYKSGYGPYYSEGGFDSMISFKISGDSVSANPQGMPAASAIDGLYSGTAADVNSRGDYNLLTYISSHDTCLARQNGMWQGTALLLMPGGIQIFYGDETARPLRTDISLGGDGHALRSDMNFGSNAAQLAHWQKVGQFRNNHVAVGAGEHNTIASYSASNGYTFSRSYSDDNVTDGVVCCIGAPANTNIAVNVSSMFGNGKTVTNEYDGSTAVVQNGKATFNSGAQGVILISGPQPTIAMSLKGGKTGFYDTQTVTLSLRGADSATVKVANGTPFTCTDGQSFTMGEGIEVGTSFEVTLTATNATETLEKSYTFKKKDPDAVTNVYFNNQPYGWNGVNIYIYKGEGTSATEVAKWPGTAMELDSDTGLYVFEVPDDFVEEGAVVFNNKGNSNEQYPAEGVRLDIEGTDKYLNGTTWKDYEGEVVGPVTEPAPGTMRTIYMDNSQFNFSTPYAYVWKNGTEDKPAVWPGTAMTQATDMGSGIYKFTCDAKYDCVIFSNQGGNQTADIKSIPYLNAMYKNGNWEEVSSGPTQPTETTKPTSPSSVPTHKVLMGDVTQDKLITVKDVTQLQRAVVDLVILSGDALAAADTDLNAKVTIKDATNIQLYIAEYSNHAKVGEEVDISDVPTTTQPAPTQPTQPTQPTDPTYPTDPTDPPVPSGLVVFTDNQGWGSVYCYAWGNGDTLGAWPGTKMSSYGTNDFGEQQYSIEIPSGTTGIIFNNGSGAQTVDISFSGGGLGYYITGWSDGKANVDTWQLTDIPPVPVTQETSQNVPSGEILFTDNQGWGQVYCYGWGSGDTLGGWPGTKMQEAGTNDFGEKQFKISIPSGTTGIIFSNGNGTQTVDISYSGGVTGYYVSGWENGKATVGSW